MAILSWRHIGSGLGALAIGLLFSFSGLSTAAGEGTPSLEKEAYGEYDVKAAYLMNFAKYVTWPEDAFEDDHAPLTVGVVGKNPFGEALKMLAKESELGGRSVEVRHGEDIASLSGCHLLFVPATASEDLLASLNDLAETPILIVGEGPRFAKRGGIISFVIVRSKVKFEINLAAARQRNLSVSSRLLKVADKVHSQERSS